MAEEAILYPAIAMFALSFAVFMRAGWVRFHATKNREVSMKYYQLFRGEEEPAHLRLISRHLQNHFEVPPMLYIVVLFTYVSGQVTALAVTLAWLFVASRCVHTAVHLGGNNVARRFYVFGFGVLILAGLWVHLLINLLKS